MLIASFSLTKERAYVEFSAMVILILRLKLKIFNVIQDL